MKHLLEVDSVQLEFNGKKLLSDIYLKVKTGDVIGLFGRNGQGKTSLFKTIYGVINCDKSVRIDNKTQPNLYLNPKNLTFLPQYHFIPISLSIKRVFNDFKLEFDTFKSNFPDFKSNINSNYSTLSGGEKRLIEIYIIVKSKSHFSILDEPFTQLNPIHISTVKKLILEEHENKGFIISDHMYENVIDISNILFVLSNGKTQQISGISGFKSMGYL
jgi:ABC-type lipopolysaccharide export system ATPase subunit